MTVPFLDLSIQYQSIQKEMDAALDRTLHRFNFIRGPEVAEFEKQFAAKVGARHCIGTGNGTDSLYLILKSLGIGHGDEVITPAFSWISSSETISLCGATPVFCDIDEETCVVTPPLLQKKITPRTRAIIVVHLYGQAAPVQEIKKFCDNHGIFLVEDCAQAHLSKDGDRVAGSVGHAAAFSFYPTKNLGAYGDAGCVITSDDELAEKVRRFANHGALLKDDHLVEGCNSRMDSLQAAVLLVKLNHLEKWNSDRNTIALYYDELLKEVSQVRLPSKRQKTFQAFHLFTIRVRERDELRACLAKDDIQTLIHYPKALPELPAYSHLKHTNADFPVSYRLAAETLSLPLYPGLSKEQIVYVGEKIKEFYGISRHVGLNH